MDEIEVRSIAASETHDLRRRVLRGGGAAATVDNPRDHDEDAWHLGAFAGQRMVGAASFYANQPIAVSPERHAAQIRYMAVDGDMRGRGIGRRLLAAALPELRRRGVEAVWANARDTALGFYVGYGFHVTGEGFTHAETGLPHHLILLDLDAADAESPQPHNPGHSEGGHQG